MTDVSVSIVPIYDYPENTEVIGYSIFDNDKILIIGRIWRNLIDGSWYCEKDPQIKFDSEDFESVLQRCIESRNS
jgi:hypothetical protein